MKNNLFRFVNILIIEFFLLPSSLQALHYQNNPFIPQSCLIIEHEGYLLAYDGRTRTAYWVYEELTKGSFAKKNANRKNMKFKVDELLPLPIRAKSGDYDQSGFDHGHLCPFANHVSDPKIAAETFLMSNICPQIHEFNIGHWYRLEKYLRKLSLNYQILHVITIPLFLPEKNFVHYQILGENQVAVPTHFCKVVFAEKKQGIDFFAYIMPNREIPNEEPLEHFRVTLDQVEHLSGVVFTGVDDKSYLPRIELSK